MITPPIYPTAVQAIAVARHNHLRHKIELNEAATFCENTEQNIKVLKSEASDSWQENGVLFFACAERGDEWIVKIRVNP